LNSFAAPLAKKLILNRPVVIQDNCIRCKKCVEVCPVEPKAIYFDKEKNKIKYHYEKCIRCFCCQETCPYDAIEVKKAPLGFLVK
jgi:ferredoxin